MVGFAAVRERQIEPPYINGIEGPPHRAATVMVWGL